MIITYHLVNIILKLNIEKKCLYNLNTSIMRFCKKCDNMYYISIGTDDENTLTYTCRNCGDVDTTISNEGMCVLDTNFKDSSITNIQSINEFTKQDPTLPRLTNMPCPNVNCSSNKDDKIDKNIIYMRYDNHNLKHIYICDNCDTTWNS
jgi:DNA-directed RNA polymerase subunit M/transcription elongation factor TFIIS